MIKQSATFPRAVCILTFCIAALVATAAGASSDDSRVNVAGYLFDHVYTSINGVVTIPFNTQDWSIDSHTIWSFRNSTASEEENDWEYLIFRRPGFTGESLKEDHVTVGVYVTMKRDKNLREEIDQFKEIYESNLHFQVDKEKRSGLRPGVVEVITLIKADEPKRSITEFFLQGETGIARIRVDSWRSDLTTAEDQQSVERLLKNILIW
jgi:hypothetical protein